MPKYDLTSDGYELNPAHIRDIRPDVLDSDGKFSILPASFWKTTSEKERALFGHQTGIYSFPTVELVEYLREAIGGRSAIEIGAGNGVLATALGILATDSFQQDQQKYAKLYTDSGFTTVPYGANVQRLSAYDAVRQRKPQVVLGCWVTHKWDPAQPWRKGNEAGIDEGDILDQVEEYLFVGNLAPAVMHSQKPIFNRPKTVEHFDWIYSRARDHKKEVIIRWPGAKAK